MNHFLLLLGLNFLAISGLDLRIKRVNGTINGAEEDTLIWPTRSKRTPAVWGAPVSDYSLIRLNGPTVYLYTILFIDLKTCEHYSNDLDRVATEVVKLVREANKYFYQLNIRIVVVDILPTYRNDLSLYTFEDFHNAHSSLPYHNFAVLVSFRYAGGLAFVSGFCSNKNVMMVGFYPHNPQAMASIFFHETCHLIGVSHTHVNETLDVPNCPCNSVSFVPKSSSQLANQTAESLLSSNTHHTEGCLKKNLLFKLKTKFKKAEFKKPLKSTLKTKLKRHQKIQLFSGFDHNCTAQLAVNLLHRSRCLPNVQRSPALNRAEGYHAEPKAKAHLLSICGNGVVEAGEECDCGLSPYCRELNCEASTCERKVAIWILALTGAGLIFVLSTILFLYGRSRLRRSKKQYSAVHTTKMINGTATQADYLATIGQLAHQLSRVLRSIKSLLCKQKPERAQETNFSTKTKLDTSSIIIVRSAQQLPTNRPITKLLERPRLAPPPPPTLNSSRPKAPPPRPPQPALLKSYGQLEQKIEYKFADFDEED